MAERLAARMTGNRGGGGLRRPAPSFSSLLGNPEDERYSPVITGADDEGKPGSDGERKTILLLMCKCPRRLALFLWIPDPPVITADGCDNWGAENDGAGCR